MKFCNHMLILLAFITASCNTPAGNRNSESVSDSIAAGPNETMLSAQLPRDTTTNRVAKKPDYNLLVGDWLRNDGGKSIRIQSILPDGKMDAAYFNPKPIHVGRAEWIIKENNLVIFIELQDVNYPGSAYTLQYYPAGDELAGIYYQAVDKVNYEVVFVRQR